MPLAFHDFAHDLEYDQLPEQVLTVLRRSFLDTMGVAAIGSTTEMAAIARQGATALFGAGSAGAARVLMDGTPLSPAGATMAGAFTIDSVDAHDGTSPCKGHAGSAVFPALLAFADTRQDMRGSDFALLLAIAYEVSYRAGLAQHASCADYHTSGAWTAVGVATALACGLDSSAHAIRQAAGIAEYHGPRSQMMRCIEHPTMLRDGVGWGAPTGVTAAYLAQAGFTGAPALTCEDAPAYWNDLGTRWRLVEDTHYKPYPCCRWAHPSIDAARDLMRTNNLTHGNIAKVDIKTFHYATQLAGHRPKTPDEFAYSIAFPVAAMIVRGQLGAAELTNDTLNDPDILRISHATTLIDDAHLTKISAGKRWAQVTLTTTDGTVYASAPRTPRGDADDPLSDTEISDKFHLFTDPVKGRDQAHRIEQLCIRFDSLNAEAFSELLDLLLSPP
ncbi:MmgE/PrpD family protein [Roseobacter sp. OBYS 0001]|uniref:MmgE/PrpD family protein n=1 Tax=Roseobacter sp. OBYS 0001 TaxID=882651 RepID=UPI001BBCDF95|nr:MmgE/PrpD family protein [Roseobacter sp. OBYS 0001]GIT85356.1 2-methylcitrate dehydratase [Roseobacter sp. OBYS 0001]